MKNVILIIFAILLTGCVPVREDGPVLDAKEVLKCPEIVEAAVKNLEMFDINPLLIQAWKESVLSKKIQPCNACQKFNTAAYILNDENEIFKPAMLEFIKDVNNEDPNKVPANKPYISDSKITDKDMEKNALARQYMRAIDDLQFFLTTEIRMSSITTRNFVLDNYFIPLLQEDEIINDPNHVQENEVMNDPNLPLEEMVEPKTQ